MEDILANIPEAYAQLSQYAAHIHSLLADVDVDNLEWYLDAMYLEYSKIRDEVSTISWKLFHTSYKNNSTDEKRWSIGDGVSSTGLPLPDYLKGWGSGSTRSSGPGSDVAVKGSGDEDEWPLSNNMAGRNITPETDPLRCLRLDLERLIDGHRRWLLKEYKKYDQSFAVENLDSITFCENPNRFRLVKALARPEVNSLHHTDIWETRFNQYNKLKRDAAELKSLTSGKKPSTTKLRRVVLETIAPYGDAILEFSNTCTSDDDEAPILRFRVSTHMLTECSPIFARMFSKHPDVLDSMPPLDLDHDLPRHPVQFSEQPNGSTIQLWRMPQVETNKESALSILLHAAHMHNEHVPRSIPFDQLVALSEAAIRYRCAKPLELFFEHCWVHQWIHKASEDMPDGLVTISYAFGRHRLFSRVTKSVILHLTDEEELRAKAWPQVVKDKIWAVRSAKMAQVYATCSETIEEYLRRPRASSAIPVSPKIDSAWSWRATSQTQPQEVPTVPLSPAATDQQPQPKSPNATKSKKDSWGWRPLSSNKLPPVGSAQRPISRPVILPPPPPPPPATISHRQTRSIDSTSSANSRNPATTLGTFPTELFTFTSTPRCPRGSHWCDATNLGWLLLVYNELRLFSAILGPSALTGLSLSPNTAHPNTPPRSLAKVLDALRGMANPPHPAHPGGGSGGVCDPVPAFRDAVNDIYNSVTGLALQEVDGLGLRHRLGLSMPRLHLEGMQSLSALGSEFITTPSKEEMVVLGTNQAGNNLDNHDVKEEIFVGREDLSPPASDQQAIMSSRPTSTAPSRALREERISLNIMRHVETSEGLRAVAVLNHRTYNIYKTHEKDLIREVALGDRIQTMMQLTANHHRTGRAEEDESYYYLRKSKYQSHGAIDQDQQEHQHQQNDDRFSSHILLSPDLLSSISKKMSNLVDDPEGASTRAIKRASSEASNFCPTSSACSVVYDIDDSDSGEDSEWNLASREISRIQTNSAMFGEDGDNEARRKRTSSFCPSLDITEGLSTASILQVVATDSTRPKSPSTLTLKPKKSTPLRKRLSRKYSREKEKEEETEQEINSPGSSWLDTAVDPDPDPPTTEAGLPEYYVQSGIEKERDSDFYSINEQEAYRILWPDEASIKSGSGPSSSMPRTSQAFGSSTSILSGNDEDLNENYTYGHSKPPTEEEKEPPQIKYSREDGSWLALKGAQFRALVGVGSSSNNRSSLEAKSLTLMTASNGNNKLLRDEFDQRQQRRGTTRHQHVEVEFGLGMGMGAVI
ncbi:hypothetical protein V8F33_001072 [Rhypophila sp. PSN 637]